MKVNKKEIISQFFEKTGQEDLDPEYQKRLRKYRPTRSSECKTLNFWKDLDEEKRPESIHIVLTIIKLSKQEKKQIRKNLNLPKDILSQVDDQEAPEIKVEKERVSKE
jgi:hypothetical protein